MTWIFIRHDPKKYANGKGEPKFDPEITTEFDTINKSILSDFTPEIILCSPFLRCRETSKRYYNEITPIIENNLSEYLGHWNDIFEHHFRDETWKYIKGTLFEKSVHDLKIRLSLLEIEKNKNVLIVTHGLCLKLLRNLFIIKGYSVKNHTIDSKFGFSIDTSSK
jgi:broad specificity phosphatase PhoE